MLRRCVSARNAVRLSGPVCSPYHEGTADGVRRGWLRLQLPQGSQSGDASISASYQVVDWPGVPPMELRAAATAAPAECAAGRPLCKLTVTAAELRTDDDEPWRPLPVPRDGADLLAEMDVRAGCWRLSGLGGLHYALEPLDDAKMQAEALNADMFLDVESASRKDPLAALQ